MYKFLIVFLLFGFLSSCCAQTQTLYAKLAWDYEYLNEVGEGLDSSDIDFILYLSAEGNTFSVYDTTAKLSYYTLQDEILYQDKLWYWYLKAHRISNNSYSQPSDTVSAFYRKILIGKAYNIQVLGIEVVD